MPPDSAKPPDGHQAVSGDATLSVCEGNDTTVGGWLDAEGGTEGPKGLGGGPATGGTEWVRPPLTNRGGQIGQLSTNSLMPRRFRFVSEEREKPDTEADTPEGEGPPSVAPSRQATRGKGGAAEGVSGLVSGVSPGLLRIALDYLTEYATGSPNEAVDAELRAAASGTGIWRDCVVTRIRGRFPVLVTHRDGYAVKVGSQGAVIECKGEVLTALGPVNAHEAARELLSQLGNFTPSGFPARVDVAADLSLAEHPHVGRWSSGRNGRVPKPSVHGLEENGAYESLTLGKRGKAGSGLQIVIYDKLVELSEREHKAAYLESLSCDYAKGGWDGSGNIYRVEIRADRTRCEENGITIAVLLDSPAKLLGLGLGWLTPSDSVTAAMWQCLSSVAGYSDPSPRPKRASSRIPDSEALVRDFTRLVARYMAGHGLDDGDDAASRLFYGMHVAEANHGLLSEYLRRYRGLYGSGVVSSNGGEVDGETRIPALDSSLPF